MKDKYGKKFQPDGTEWTITRREFLMDSGLVIAGLSFGIPIAHANRIYSKAKLSFGIVTDVHYADAEPNGTRWYRESITKSGVPSCSLWPAPRRFQGNRLRCRRILTPH